MKSKLAYTVHSHQPPGGILPHHAGFLRPGTKCNKNKIGTDTYPIQIFNNSMEEKYSCYCFGP
jgi:hypothetical protein